MFKVLKSVSTGVLILLCLPLLVWVSGWHWQPDNTLPLKPVLFAFTETVTRPWGILTSLLLGGWLLWLRYGDGAGLRELLQTAVLVVLVVWGGQGINTLIKHYVQEPRPYTLWISRVSGTSVDPFYHLSGQERGQLVERVTGQEPFIPGWLRQHWAYETGYAFPSGHSMFAACWALLMLVLAGVKRHYVTVVATFVWAIVVMGSRMALGMHWPQDVIMSVMVAGITLTVACALFRGILSERVRQG